MMRSTDMKDRYKFQKSIGYFVMAASVMMMLVVYWMAYIPVKVIDIKNPIQVVDKDGKPLDSIKAGERFFCKVEYRKYLPLASDVVVTLVNMYYLSFPAFKTVLPLTDKENLKDPNYYDVVLTEFRIPTSAMPGKHYLNIMVSQKVNALRTQNMNLETTKFTVTSPDGVLSEDYPYMNNSIKFYSPKVKE